jgi:type I restriction enzyme S subunit
MELKPGYKQTDVGNISVEWNAPVLGELFDFKNGLNKGKQYFGHGTPIVNYMDVYGNCGLYAHDLRGRVDVNKQELKAFEVRKGDVFFTRTSETVEELGIASVMLDDSPDTVFSGFVLRARPNNDDLDDQFKKYCFSPFVVRKQITSKSTYTTRALTNGRLLSAIAIACPPKPEQRTIAKVLTDVDALLDTLEELIAKKRDLKQGAMQELLTGKKRLPGFEKTPGYKKTEAGVIPEDWNSKPLADLGSWKGGATPSMGNSRYWLNGTVPWLSSGDIKDTLISDAPMKITESAVKETSATLLPPNSIMFVTRSGILRKYLPRRKKHTPFGHQPGY